MAPSALDLLVFRETRQQMRGPGLKSTLLRELAQFPVRPSRDNVMAALLRAGELECAVADANQPTAGAHSQATDRLAKALLEPESPIDRSMLAKDLAETATPDHVLVSPPEGFAYYALHPLAFAEALAKIPSLAASALVVGIRSIGTTLSAITAVSARKLGLHAQRFTVRPGGHPYNRQTQFSPGQLDLIRRSAACGADFMVVDEGPGLSGSSFLSVAEALERAGAARERITLICGHQPDFDSLRADDGPWRARRFRWVAATSPPRRPANADLFMGGGEWRKLLFPGEDKWPACWTSLERLKYLSAAPRANQKLFKFRGFGHYGQEAFEREEQLAAAGFGPRPTEESDGFASYDWLRGGPMSVQDISTSALQRLAKYCAFRAQAFAADVTELSALEQMTNHNLCQLGIDLGTRLPVERPAICDGRMQPHEWLLAVDGQMLKTDSGSHGDDHFFPGPADIAWDLAGAVVEWQMDETQTEFLLEAYRRASGDDARGRIANFTTAYAVFRSAYSRMAANALPGGDEEARFQVAEAAYRGVLEQLGQVAASQP
jgi:hypothetical protein